MLKTLKFVAFTASLVTLAHATDPGNNPGSKPLGKSSVIAALQQQLAASQTPNPTSAPSGRAAAQQPSATIAARMALVGNAVANGLHARSSVSSPSGNSTVTSGTQQFSAASTTSATSTVAQTSATQAAGKTSVISALTQQLSNASTNVVALATAAAKLVSPQPVTYDLLPSGKNYPENEKLINNTAHAPTLYHLTHGEQAILVAPTDLLHEVFKLFSQILAADIKVGAEVEADQVLQTVTQVVKANQDVKFRNTQIIYTTLYKSEKDQKIRFEDKIRELTTHHYDQQFKQCQGKWEKMTSCYVFDAAKSRGHRFTVSNLVEMVEALSTRPIYQGSSLIASGRHAFHGGNQNIIQGLKSDAVTLSYALEEALRWYDGYVRMQETAIARAKSMASSKNGRKSPNSLV